MNALNTLARFASQNPLLERLALVSLELALLAALVGALIGVLRIGTPRLRALLWLIVLAKPLLGLALGTPLPLLRFAVTSPAATPGGERDAIGKALAETAPGEITAVAAGPAATQNAAQPASSPAWPAQPAAAPAAKPAETNPATARSPFSPARAAILGWLAFVLASCGYLALDMRRLGRLVRQSTAAEPRLQGAFDAFAHELKLRAAPRLRVSDALDSPALAGLVRPVVLLPRWIAEQARPEQVEWLLRHELMHYKMRDPLGLAVRRLAEILFFFHPAVWLAGRKWEEAMELACDRALLSTNDDARNYAEQLYWVLEHRANRQRFLRAGLCAARTQIGKRIASLLSNPVRFSAHMNAAALSGLVIVALVGLSVGVGFHEPAKAAEPRPRADAKASATALNRLPSLMGPGPQGDALPGVPPALQPKFKQAQANLYWVNAAIEVYVQRNGALPESLAQLLVPYTKLERIPPDPFAPGKPLSYRLSADKQEATVYSVGPDGKDDGGESKMLPEEPMYEMNTGAQTPGTVLAGDIAERFSLPSYRERAESDRKQTAAIRRALEEIRRQTGRDNAMLHYIDAGNRMGSIIGALGKSPEEFDLVQATLAHGWTEESRPLLITLARFEPSLAEIRKGAALDDAVNTIGDGGPLAPVPNFLTAQTLSRILCLEGLWRESQGKYDEALDDYLTVLTMGRDYFAPQPSLISGLISISIQSLSLHQITRLAADRSTNRDLIGRAAARLKQIETTEGPFTRLIDSEYPCLQYFFDLARKNPEQLRDRYADMFKTKSLPGGADEFIRSVDRLDADHRKLFDWLKRRSETPRWLRADRGYDEAGYAKLLETLHPFTRETNLNWPEAETRYAVLRAVLSEARIVAALELYRRDTGNYPDDLAALAPSLIEAVPVDPFSGKPFPYARDGDSFRLWSVGPDATSDNAAVRYDPTNGSLSAGDLVPVR